MSHPFQKGVGGRDESPEEGWGDRDESSKRGDKGGGELHQSQPRGGGGGQIMLMCGRSGYLTTHIPSSYYRTTCTSPVIWTWWLY